jgi:3-hydroxybutyryl-CoA dehydratase
VSEDGADGEEATGDPPLSVGDTLTTGSRTITEADVVNFAGVSGDFNRLHVDREADNPFGERIVHGSLVFSVMTGLAWQARGGDAAPVFYGVDDMRFVQPVFIDDTLSATLEVTEVVETDVAGASLRITQRAEVTNQHDETVLTADLLALL